VRISKRIAAVLFAMSIALAAGLIGAEEPATLRQTDVSVSGADGYHTYRIPSLIVSKKGTLLAFCEGRKDGRAAFDDF